MAAACHKTNVRIFKDFSLGVTNLDIQNFYQFVWRATPFFFWGGCVWGCGVGETCVCYMWWQTLALQHSSSHVQSGLIETRQLKNCFRRWKELERQRETERLRVSGFNGNDYDLRLLLFPPVWCPFIEVGMIKEIISKFLHSVLQCASTTTTEYHCPTEWAAKSREEIETHIGHALDFGNARQLTQELTFWIQPASKDWFSLEVASCFTLTPYWLLRFNFQYQKRFVFLLVQ